MVEDPRGARDPGRDSDGCTAAFKGRPWITACSLSLSLTESVEDLIIRHSGSVSDVLSRLAAIPLGPPAIRLTASSVSTQPPRCVARVRAEGCVVLGAWL